MAPSNPLIASVPTRILDAALNRAAVVGWDALHLYEVADDLGMDLAELSHHVADKHSLGQLIFDRADRSLLDCTNRPLWRDRPSAERLEVSLMAWFQTLAPHHEQVRQILRYQLQPDHLHLQVEGVLRISRTVQWWREASCLPATGLKRELLETALTAIYLSTVTFWLRHDPLDQARTGRWLAWHLRLSSRAGQVLLRL